MIDQAAPTARGVAEDQAIGRWPTSGESVAAAIIALCGAVAVAYVARDWWFHADAWSFLARRSWGEPLSLLRPHAGHWNTAAAVVFATLRPIFGMDFWPWYYLPRLVVWAAMSWWIWRVLRLRGAHRVTALAVLGVVLVLGASAYQDGATIGNPIVLGVAPAVALVLAGPTPPTARQRWLLFGLLVVAVSSAGVGLAVLVSTLVITTLRPGSRPLFPSALGALAVYGVWYTAFRLGSEGAPIHPSAVLDLPLVAYEVLGTAGRVLLSTSTTMGYIVGIAALAGLAWLLVRRRLDVFDATLVVAALMFIGLVTVVRVASGASEPSAGRYAQNITLLLLPVLVPKLAPVASPRRAWVCAAAAVLLIPLNFTYLERGIDFWERRAQASREVVEASALLIARGEGYLPGAAVDPPRTGQLVTDDVARLVDQGWDVNESPARATVEHARAYLRTDVRPEGESAGEAPVSPQAGAGGCALIEPGRPVMLTPASATITVASEAPTPVDLMWEDERGPAHRTFTIGAPGRMVQGASLLWVRLDEPAGEATVTLVVDEGSALVCGLRAP